MSKARSISDLIDDNGLIKAEALAITSEAGEISVNSLPTIPDSKIESADDWNTAYGWGDHAAGGYQDAATAITTSNIASQTVASANSLATARSIALSGDVSGSASFDGSANVTITATIADDSHNHIIANVDGLQAALDSKVDEIEGKGLSTEDYTTAEKSKLAGIESGAEVNTVDSVAGKTGVVTLEKSDVGLGNVDNTSDLNKPISTATQTALNAKAPLASPALTGTPTAPTAVAGTNTTQVATTAFVQGAVSNLVDTAPEALNTLNELAAALGDDPNFATTVSTQIGTKLDSSAYTAADVLTKIKTVDGASSGLDADLLDGQHASAFAPVSHTHTIANVTGLQTALDGKAAVSHSHAISDVTGLQTALDGKAPLTGTGASGTWGISITGNAGTASRITGGNLSPFSTAFNNSIAAAAGSSNRVVTFDGNGATPSVWWSNGGTAIGAIDGNSGGGLNFWSNNGSTWQQQVNMTYGSFNVLTSFQAPIFYDSNNTAYYVDPAGTSNIDVLNNFSVVSGATECGIRYRVNSSAGDFSGRYSNYVALYNGISDKEIKIFDSSYISFNAYGLNSESWRAPIFYDSNNTAYYVDPSSISEFWRINAADYIYTASDVYGKRFIDIDNQAYYVDPSSTSTSVQVAGAIEQGNNYSHPNVEWSASSGSTGMVIFYLPGTTSNYGMIHMVFDLYEYTTGRTATVIVGGHNWSTSWYNNGCQVIGETNKAVRLGVKNGRFCVIFGGVGSSWNYGTVRLRKIHNASFYDNVMDLGGNWSAELTNTESFSYVSGDLRQLRTSNTFTADGDIRSPIFYDSNNTGYYVDPSSTGVSLNIAGQIQCGIGIDGDGIRINHDQVWSPAGNLHLQYSGGGDIDMCFGGGYAFSRTSFRAPIFYDFNNTGYYVDPASTSALYDLTLIGAKHTYLYINPGNGREAMVRYNGGSGSGWYVGKRTTSQLVGTESFHFYSEAASRTLAGVDTSGNIFSDGSVRSPIFYDYNDTSYYCDPTSRSNLIAVRTGATGQYNHFLSWTDLQGHHGIYSSVHNGAHFYPNNGTYGAWKVDGSRNGWAGLEFPGGVQLMMNYNGHGIHRQDTGWMLYSESRSLYIPGDVTAYWSDERLKENFVKIDREALDILSSFTAYRFNWNEKVAMLGDTIPVGKEEIGLIAQHVQKTLPDAVKVNKAGAPVDGDEDFDYLTINYDRITPLLVEGVNIHEKEIKELKEEVAQLKALVKKLIGE